MGEGQLTSSSVPEAEAGHTVWSDVAPYAVGAKVIRDRRRWTAIQAVTGHDPATDVENAWWTFDGPTNRWAMFDQAAGTLTTATGELEVVLAPGRVDSLALIDIDAASVTVTMTSGGVPVYERQQSTSAAATEIDNWWSWFFEPIGKRSTLIFDDMPPYSNAVVTVTISASGPAGAVSVGTMLVGRMLEFGATEAGPSVGINDFSLKEVDAFGHARVVPRTWTGKMTLRAIVDTSRVDTIRNEMAALRATPALWIGEDGFDCLAVYGFFKSFSIDLALETKSYLSAEIEGLSEQRTV